MQLFIKKIQNDYNFKKIFGGILFVDAFSSDSCTRVSTGKWNGKNISIVKHICNILFTIKKVAFSKHRARNQYIIIKQMMKQMYNQNANLNH